eukprot:6193791-Pleurochrysis_carterae.AAC.1
MQQQKVDGDRCMRKARLATCAVVLADPAAAAAAAAAGEPSRALQHKIDRSAQVSALSMIQIRAMRAALRPCHSRLVACSRVRPRTRGRLLRRAQAFRKRCCHAPRVGIPARKHGPCRWRRSTCGRRDVHSRKQRWTVEASPQGEYQIHFYTLCRVWSARAPDLSSSAEFQGNAC